LINDLYKRFINKNKDEKHYVIISRELTMVMMIISVVVTIFMTTISGVWAFVIECGAGLGLILILRWFWWKINAISEIVATVTPFIVYGALYFGKVNVKFPETLYIIVPITTVAWLITVFITKPVEENKLIEFYRRVHPGGPGWKKISSLLPDVKSDSGYRYLFMNWVCGIILVYTFLFGIGDIILGDSTMGLIYIVLGLGAGTVIFKNFKYIGWEIQKE
jgi:Na+/proline symporter